jgi:glycosyltransferase involved in cell wall biosynthesis
MKRIAFFIPTMDGGGAERVVLNLLKGMLNKDLLLDLVVADALGPYLQHIPKQVRVINLGVGRVLKAIIPLSEYLKKNRPSALISHLNHANIVAVLANKLSRIKTSVILVEHDTLSSGKSDLIRAKFLPSLMKFIYPYADEIVGVSEAVSRDLEIQLKLSQGRVKTIYNPVVNLELMSQAKEPLDHPWFAENSPPVFLAIGRLTEKKDFFTLIKAFAQLREKIPARMIILGEGELRNELETLISKLNISHDILMPGFVENPYSYMSRAKVFVLSSLWEGLPTVLIEAMACGCQVVSTDCPSGPKEILDGGKYGALVPMLDISIMCKAMLEALNIITDKEILVERAMYFSVENSVNKYLSMISNNTNKNFIRK